MKKLKKHEFYCENCFLEPIPEIDVIYDKLGGIFCSKKCKKEFAKVMKENRRQ